MGSKQELVGRTLKVVVANRYGRDRNYSVAYPMLHGPVILVKGGDFAGGDVLKVKITGVASDRMVYASKI